MYVWLHFHTCRVGWTISVWFSKDDNGIVYIASYYRQLSRKLNWKKYKIKTSYSYSLILQPVFRSQRHGLTKQVLILGFLILILVENCL